MGQPFVLQSEFAGMWRDSARDSLPSGKLWDCVDLIPEYLNAPLRVRGSTSTYYTIASTPTEYIVGLFSGTLNASVNLAITSGGTLYSSSGSLIGSGIGFAQNPVLHRAGATPIMVAPGATPKSYDGTTYQSLAGSPPGGIYADVWNDRTLLANSSALPQRLWFGPVGNAAGTWDTTNSWIDTRLSIVGVAAIRTGIIVFHAQYTGLITGTTPPSATTIGDLTVRSPAFSVGCMSVQTIVKYNDTVLWADQRGIYQSDGNTVKDLTYAGGMSSYWRALAPYFPGFSGGIIAGYSYAISAGITNDTYIIAITQIHTGSVTPVVCLAYDLKRGFWYRISGITPTCFTNDPNKAPVELIYGDRTVGSNVVAMAGIFDPDTSGSYGTSNVAALETAFYRGNRVQGRKWVKSYGIQSWRRAYATYQTDAIDGAVSLQYATDLNGNYSNVSHVFSGSGDLKRDHANIFVQGNGLAFKAFLAGDAYLYSLEAEYSGLETSRLAQ